jgi:uncharacterized protein (DUF427 family)
MAQTEHAGCRFGGIWIADSEHVLLLFEPGRYPVAYFPETDVSPHTLERTDHTTQHPDLGLTFSVHLDGTQLHLEPGQTAVPHGPDRNLILTDVVRPANH